MTDIVDKHGWLNRLSGSAELVLELGCGPQKRVPEAIGIDQLDFPAVDLVGDVNQVLAQFPTGSARHISSSHFLEHVSDLDTLLRQITRVLANDGVLETTVPHFSNPYFYSDPTHQRTFGLYTFCYFAKSALFTREVPQYGKDFGLLLEDVRLRFDSPFKWRRISKRWLGNLINRSRYLQELYEEQLCSFLPCYEITYVARRSTRNS